MNQNYINQIKRIILLLLTCFCVLLCPRINASAESANNLSEHLSQMSLNGDAWYYGDAPLSVSVPAEQSVSLNLVGYYTKSQWLALTGGQARTVSLKYALPDGVSFSGADSSIFAVISDKQTEIGRVASGGGTITARIEPKFAQLMGSNDNIELCITGALNFESGQFELGKQFYVTSSVSSSSSAHWNNYAVTLNKTDADNSSQLLGNACFTLSAASYDEQKQQFSESKRLPVTSDTFSQNDTFQPVDGQIVTTAGQSALLLGSFEPGTVYTLTETKAPVGYHLPEAPEQFAFYRYSENEKAGTTRLIQALNATYESRYHEVSGLLVLGEVNGTSGGGGTIHAKNEKISMVRLIKTDAETAEPLARVTFTLQADARTMDYTSEEYLSITAAGWTYDKSTHLLTWVQATDEEGRITYPAGTIPYAENGVYTLIETVPDGYAASGSDRTKSGTFKVLPNGSFIPDSDFLAITTGSEVTEISIQNKKALRLDLHKTNAANEPLADAEFSLYGSPDLANGTETSQFASSGSSESDRQAANDRSPLSINGETYVHLSSGTTDETGILSFFDLPYGIYYVKETKAPKGFALPAAPTMINVSSSSASLGAVSVTIVNHPDTPDSPDSPGGPDGPGSPGGPDGPEKKSFVPFTGGRGIAAILTIGLLLIAAGAALLYLTSGPNRKKHPRLVRMRRLLKRFPGALAQAIREEYAEKRGRRV